MKVDLYGFQAEMTVDEFMEFIEKTFEKEIIVELENLYMDDDMEIDMDRIIYYYIRKMGLE